MLESNQLHRFRRPRPDSLDQWDFSEIAGFEPADPFKGIDSLAMSSFKPGSRKSPDGGECPIRTDGSFMGIVAFRVRWVISTSLTLLAVAVRVERTYKCSRGTRVSATLSNNDYIVLRILLKKNSVLDATLYLNTSYTDY